MKKFYRLPKAICVFNEFVGKKLINAGGAKKQALKYTKRVAYCHDEHLYMNFCESSTPALSKRPVFFYVHGGGWVSGYPENREGLVSRFAEAGYFCASIFYGWSPEYKHPSPVVSIYEALAFLISNKDKYNIDTDNIFIGGESAGAHLAALVAAISTNDELKAHYSLNAASVDVTFKGAFLICGIYEIAAMEKCKFPFIRRYCEAYFEKDFKDILSSEEAKYASPLCFVNGSFPKSFVVTAQHDQLTGGGKDFIEVLNKNGVRTETYHGTGVLAVHAFVVAQLLKQSKEAVSLCLNLFGEKD